MTDDPIPAPPADSGWRPFDHAGFEALAGPLYWSAKFVSEDEPIRMGFRVAPKHCNPQNVCHGGMMATFLDMTLGLTLRAATKVNGPTMTLTIDYLSPAAVGDWIESRSRFVHASFRTGYCDVIALGPRGPVARANGMFRNIRPESGAAAQEAEPTALELRAASIRQEIK